MLAPPVKERPDAAYAWQRLPTGPGGWVTGLVIHSRTPGVMYARTDTGGAYRFEPSTGTWQQMILTSTVSDRLEGLANDYNSRPGRGVKQMDTTYFTRLVLNWR